MVTEPLSLIKQMQVSALKKIKFWLSRGGPLYAKATTMSDDPIAHNVRMHDRVAPKYEQIHPEIFNPIEQARIQSMLKKAMTYLDSQGENICALDFGAGSGNLTRHMLNCGMHVVAADISNQFLTLIQRKFENMERVSTFTLNGRDLSGLHDNTFDLVAAYSVLHHIPDYLQSIREMVRVLKPGGLILIDHETSENYWSNVSSHRALRKLASNTKLTEDLNIFSIPFVKLFRTMERLIRAIKRHILRLESGEGDIHVYMDDHIDWNKVVEILTQTGLEVVHQEDYLAYNGIYSEAVWKGYKDALTDTRLIIAKKRG